VALLATSLALSGAAFAADTQRMVLAPAGCRVLPPGGYDDASAYCLDQARARPADGVILSDVLASLDEATVRVAGAPPLSLAEALARRVVEVVGRGTDRVVRLKNLTDQSVEICITGPTVVMGAGEAEAHDLARIGSEIKRLVRAPAADDGAHDAIQRKLWAAINDSDQQENKKMAHDLAPAVLFPSRQKPALSGTRQRKCAGDTEKVDVRLCTE
jgi:hypothetical protein